MILNLNDRNFSHQVYSSKFGSSDKIEWDRTCSQKDAPTVYTDMCIHEALMDKGEKIFWLVEPESIHPHIYKWIEANYSGFKEVWTHNENLLNVLPNAKFVPTGGCWTEEIDIFEKPKLCSLIASNKNWTYGHKLRQLIRHNLHDSFPSIDQFGKGYKELNRKVDGLKDYAYSITVENAKLDTYFTEKIIDCFLTGTIPIYYGTDNISKFFNPDGILMFNNLKELHYILYKTASLEDYNNRLDAVKENFELAKKYIIPEEFGI